MPEPKPNNPYARPIGATKEDATPLLGYWGQRDASKARQHSAGLVEASQVRALPSVVPHWPDEDEPKPKRRTKAETPKAQALDEPVVVTEDDLFG